MTNPLQNNLVRCAKDHGFDAERHEDGSVTVLIPAINIHTDEKSIVREHVTSMREMRGALGY